MQTFVVKNLATLQAYYLNKPEEAIALLEEVISNPSIKPVDKADYKILQADIYLVSGAYDSYSHPLNKPEEMHIIHVKPGDIVKTPPLVAHAQKFTEDSVFLAITTRMREEGILAII